MKKITEIDEFLDRWEAFLSARGREFILVHVGVVNTGSFYLVPIFKGCGVDLSSPHHILPPLKNVGGCSRLRELYFPVEVDI